MALKIERKLAELQRTKERIRELQDKQAMLEKSIKKDEDEEIVRVLRSLHLGHEELVQVLLGIQNGSISAEDLKQRKEEKKKAPQPTKGEAIQSGASTTDTANALPLWEPGAYVRLKGQDTIGQIKKINGDEALVVFGQITTNVKLKRLIPSEPPKKDRNVASTFVSVQTRDDIRQTTLNFKEQLDVRGMRGEEAIQAVTYFIDDALVARASRVKILHGTGTGALKTVIRQYLNTMPPVADFYDEDIRFGGAGITIVELI